MAAVAEIASEAAVAAKSNSNTTTNKNDNNNNLDSERNPKSESEFTVQKLVDMFTKLNPLAKEFFPSSYNKNNPKQFHINNFPVPNKQSANDNFPKRRRNDFNQGRRRLNGRAYRAQREDSIRRTVYVSDIDQHVTEEQLAGLFSGCGQVMPYSLELLIIVSHIEVIGCIVCIHRYLHNHLVVVDCRICGDPRSVLRFAFVEFAVEQGARAALNLGGTMLGYYPVRVLPSKTAILPVNPTFLPQSEDEREMCTRTVYCTNIEKKVSQAEVKNFFESICGEVTRLRLLGDHVHSTRIAFVEFAMAESAIVALNCSGMVLGSQPVRVSPSKTPVRPRVTRLALH
ncbi:polyadenylate-binding protein-interacting protein 8-like isoform X1 [Populus nigra]|uniref:polyadenylate-binding protein-interacting protein 8-like isoform X1 n=1 Tax=Populus nigra TaxID=3691 RepID=UPI002B2653D3|nr:polyadenylate-binding protein-interacting protein 8-like isoform X1 [Populus nigra]